MPGVSPSTLARPLQRIQSFKETAWGTPGLATAKWMLISPNPTFTPKYQVTVIDEDRGSLAPGYVAFLPELGGTFSIAWTASFEDIIFTLGAALGAVSPTGSFTWTYAAPLTAAYSPQTYSLELAYDIANVVAQGVLTQKLSIKGNQKKDWTLTQSGIFQQLNACAPIAIASSTNANPIKITTSTTHGLISGMQVVVAGHAVNTGANGTWPIVVSSPTEFTLTGTTGVGVGGNTGTVTQTITPAIADRTVEPILFAGETALAIDPAATAPGTTAVTSALVDFQLDIDNQMQGFFTGDQKYPTDFAQDKLKVELTLRLKWNAQTKALYDTQWIKGNSTVFQIKATSGSKSCEIDFSGVLSADPVNYEVDFNALTQELKFSGIYDTGSLANYLKIIAVNSVSALP